MFALNSLIVSLSFMFTTAFPPSKIEWTTPKSHDFGLIVRGVEAKHIFTFRNLSKTSLKIDNIRTDCTCTASDWDIAPVAPDSTGKITVSYDARKKGYFKKRLTVWIHGQKNAEQLIIEGEVEE
jgi:hypothetical protein